MTKEEILYKLENDYPQGYDYRILRAAAVLIRNDSKEIDEVENTYADIKKGWLNNGRN
jgi:hypothetical protein